MCAYFSAAIIFVCANNAMCLRLYLCSPFSLLFFYRGFGFVTFADAASVDKVLAQTHHELDSKTVSSLPVFFLLVVVVCVTFHAACTSVIAAVFHESQ